MANQINFKIGFTVDKSGLNEIAESLRAVRRLTTDDLMSLNKGMKLSEAKTSLVEIQRSVSQLQTALSNSFNSDIGTLNITKFNQELKNLNLSKIATDFNNAGAEGQIAFKNIATKVLTTNQQLKTSSALLDKMATTMANTIRWGIASSVMNGFVSSVQEAYNYVLKLDSSLNDIRVVTGKSAEEMASFASTANEAAQALSASTRDITEGALIYYQQGDDDETALAKAEITQKVANVSQISSEDASEYLTAVWNGYQAANEAAEEGMDAYEEYADKLAAVAATQATNLEETSIAMSKVASTANMLGVDFDQLNAQIATIISVTRQAPESVGTALKTIYARLGDLQVDGEDEYGVALGTVSSTMEELGIEILDETGNMREMGEVIEDTAEKWQTWTDAQKQAAAVAMAGKRQYNNLIALFDNWDTYTASLETSQNALGTLQEQQDTYAERTEARIQVMSTAFENLYDSLFDTDDINGVVDAITEVVNGLATFLDGVGGGKTLLIGLGAIATQVFSRQISSGLARVVENFQKVKENAAATKAEIQVLQQFKDVGIADGILKTLVEYKEKQIQYSSVLSQKENEEINALIAQTNELENQQLAWGKKLQSLSDYSEKILQLGKIDFNIPFGDSDIKDTLVTTLDSIIEKETEYNNTIEKTLSAECELADQESILLNVTRQAEEEKIKIGNVTEATSKKQKAAQEGVTKAEEQATKAIERQIVAMKKLANSQGVSAKQKSTLISAINEYQKAVSQLEQGKIDTSALKNLTNAFQEVFASVISKAKKMRNIVAQEAEGMSQNYAQSLEKVQRLLNQIFDTKAIAANIQSVVRAISSLGQISMGFSSLGNLKNIFSDDTLTAGEQLLQTLSAIGMGLPMVISGFRQLNQVLGVSTLVTNLYAVAKGKIAAASGFVAQKEAVETAALAANNAMKKLTIVYEKDKVKQIVASLWATGELTASTSANTVAEKISAEVKKTGYKRQAEMTAAGIALSNQRKVDTQLTFLQTAAQEGLNAALKANPIAAVVLGLTALAAAIAAVVWWYDAVTVSAEEAREELDNHITAYNEISSELESQQSELESVQRQIAEINEEGLNYTRAETLSDLKLQEQYLKSQIKLNEILLKQEQKKIAAAAGQAIEAGAFDLTEEPDYSQLTSDSAMGSGDDADGTYTGTAEASENLTLSSTDVSSYYDQISGLKEFVETDLNDFGYGVEGEDDYTAWQTTGESLIADAKAKLAAATTEEEKERFQTLVDWLTTYYGAASQTYNDYNEDLLEWYRETVDDENGLSRADEAMAILQQGSDSVDEEIWNKSLELVNNYYRFIGNLGSYVETALSEDEEALAALAGDTSYLTTDENGEAVVDQGKLKEIIGEEAFTAIAEECNNAQVDINEVIISYIEAIEAGEALANTVASAAEQAKTKAANAQDALSALSSGDELSDEQIENLEALESEYEELAAIRDRTSHEYLETLREVKEQEEANAMSALENEKTALEESLAAEMHTLEVTIDETELEEQVKKVESILEDLAEKEYEIKVQIDEDLASDVTDAFDIADELGQVQDLIHDDLTYTFDEAQKIIEAGYGELFINAQETADNTIQVNQDVASAFIDNQQAEIEASRQAKIAQLEQERQYLLVCKEYLNQKVSNLELAAQAETSTEAAKYLYLAQMADARYQSEMILLQNALNGENETSDKIQATNSTLYQMLNGMYVQDSTNEQTAEDEATDNQAENIDIRVSNVRLLNTAYTQLAQTIKAAMAGDVAGVAEIAVKASSGGAGVETSGGNNEFEVSSSSSATDVDLLKEEQRSLRTATQQYNSILAAVEEIWSDQGTYQATVQKLIDEANTEIQNVDGQIGAIDSGIAALKSASTSLDTTQALLGSSDSSDSSGSGSDSGSGSGSDSGSSSEAENPDYLEYLEDEIDRYHDINLEIEKIETSLERLQEQQDKLYGKDLLNNLDEQLEVLEQQIAAYKTKIALAQAETAEIRLALAAQGVTFDANGYITNYAAVLQAQLNYVNSLIDQYNAMSAEEQEGFKDTVETAQDAYEEFKEQIEDYEELISSTIPEIEDSIQEAIDEEIEINITKFTTEIELRLELAEAEKDWAEFKAKVIDELNENDGLYGAQVAVDTIAAYFSNKTLEGLKNQVANTIAEINKINAEGWSDAYGDNKTQAMEDLENYMEELMDSLEDIRDQIDEFVEAISDAFDDVADSFEAVIDQYDYINDTLEHEKELISLLYGDEAYSQMTRYYDEVAKNNLNILDTLKQEVDYFRNELDEAIANSADPEIIKTLTEKWEDAQSAFNDAIEDSVENLVEKYSNAIDEIIQNLENSLTDGLGFDYLEDEWDLINENADRYLDTVNRVYSIQKLENKYIEAINDEDSISGQKQLTELMNEQLTMLREKENLSEYDVERAEKVYEIALKQIALQNAQANKSTMRLRRDSQGNYSYQYVSDEDSIAEARQELSDAQNDLYNFDKDAYQNNLDEALNILQEYVEAVQEVMEDSTLTEEERQQKIALLRENYEQLYSSIVADNEDIRINLKESAFDALATLYENDAAAFEAMAANENETMSNLVAGWDGNIQHFIDIIAGEGGLESVTSDSFKEMDNAVQAFKDDIKEVESVAKTSFDNVDQEIAETTDFISKNLIPALEDTTTAYQDQAEQIKSVLIPRLQELRNVYQQVYEAAKKSVEAGYEKLQQEKASAADAASGSSSGASSSSTSSNGSSSSGSGTSATSNNGVIEIGDQVTFSTGQYYNDSFGSSPLGNKYLGNKVYVTKTANGNPYPIHIGTKPTMGYESDLGWIKKNQITGYDTGGYTGEWGDNGKLAVLHQKELVLKDTDTENILSAVTLVRNIESFIANLNQSVVDKISSTMAGIISGFAGLSADETLINQNVKIEASFPNVKDSSEIERALNNIVNTASQYAFNQNR